MESGQWYRPLHSIIVIVAENIHEFLQSLVILEEDLLNLLVSEHYNDTVEPGQNRRDLIHEYDTLVNLLELLSLSMIVVGSNESLCQVADVAKEADSWVCLTLSVVSPKRIESIVVMFTDENLIELLKLLFCPHIVRLTMQILLRGQEEATSPGRG